MHEGAIVNSILNLAAEVRAENKLKEISAVRIIVGEIHQVVDEVLLQLFDIMKVDKEGFHNAVLDVEKRAVKIKCIPCQVISKLDGSFFICPECSSTDVIIQQGNELDLASLEGEQ